MIPRWAVDVLSCVGFVFIWCIIATAAGILIGRWIRGPRTPAPAASTPRAPGPYPGEGPPAGPPNPNAGEPSPGLEPRLLMSSRFYSDGVVYVDDHIKRTTRRFDPPPGDDLEVSDAEIERWLSDGVD